MLVRFIVAANRIGSPRQQFTDFTGSHLHVILIDQPHFVIRRHRTPLRMHRYILRVIQPGIIHQAFRHPVYLLQRTSQHRFTRLAASALNLAPPTCSTCRFDRSSERDCAASIQIKARGGTTAVMVTPSEAISGNATSGLADRARTTFPPAYSVPSTPGELSGKLWAAGSTAK